MKVLHLVAGGIIGGAGWGAYWFHQALRELGVESTLLTNAPDNGGDTLVIALTKKTSGQGGLRPAVAPRQPSCQSVQKQAEDHL